MELDEIARLYKSLNLDKTYGSMVQMNHMIYEKGKEHMDLCHVGKVMTRRLVNREALDRIMNFA